MLKFRKGCKVPFPEKLSEGYEYNAPWFTANVGADKMKTLLTHFIAIHNEPLFFILELPSTRDEEPEGRSGIVEALHKEVYYIDGCTQKSALEILDRIADLVINDGLCSFGFGCHRTNDEIMIGKYNVVSLYSPNERLYDGFFKAHGIDQVENLLTAWDIFTKESPGESIRVDTNGKSIYDIPDMLKDLGIYLAEQREE